MSHADQSETSRPDPDRVSEITVAKILFATATILDNWDGKGFNPRAQAYRILAKQLMRGQEPTYAGIGPKLRAKVERMRRNGQ